MRRTLQGANPVVNLPRLPATRVCLDDPRSLHSALEEGIGRNIRAVVPAAPGRGSLFAKGRTFVRYVAAREAGHRLYCRVASWGILLFIVSLVLLSLLYGVLHRYERFHATQRFLAAVLQPFLKDRGQADSQLDYLLVCLTSVPIGRCLPSAVNRLMKQTTEQVLWAAVETNELEELLLEAMSYAKSISITMSSDKVYVPLARRPGPRQLPLATLGHFTSPSHHSHRVRREQRVEKLQPVDGRKAASMLTDALRSLSLS